MLDDSKEIEITESDYFEIFRVVHAIVYTYDARLEL